MNKKCLIMAGGTGGHVFPALAVAQALRDSGWHIDWLGTEDRMEAQVVPAHGFPIHYVKVRGIRGKGLLLRLTGLVALLKSTLAARNIIRQVTPDLIIGFGGYASGPGGVAGWLAGVPLLIHEQNAKAGMTNRLLGRIAKKILLGFDDAKSAFNYASSRCVTVGNPVRESFINATSKEATHQPLRLLVVGGSLGARALNIAVPRTCKKLQGLTIWHQCGKGNVNEVNTAYEDSEGEVKVTEFIDDMASAYKWADMIICRAGALTVAEVAASGTAAIFVPLPHAVDDHQTQNAMSLVKHHAGVMIKESQLQDNLGAAVRLWLNDPAACLTVGKKAREFAMLDATKNVVHECESVLEAAA
ncbi:undecaprenyldiphospho-muramoylpentapeptide beta-N-acetylglucosaminyltransferase [Alteromonas ponticola]|uniref:UDP-N-acetylglucosamine--N-acetylmuramyl-(pentapeptide) pyrophosphoryl-undecaprenol N-acetylglucosamine transferase n=1 Tax=Alteromonas aquimaris TaxID=2998417 RepID=A0ABT3P2T7_9ALTE|nr:undecaprenyldiphospho-muramoylpentapeptide beta-N-acetylglucosaminyltransferase [Alteromonas aquimaris]MCW8107066.1 undecaprenyldiphospho-muramoylpentapeptide beta-N-acetylglucosaminyltransferase [Alteromonas aquimaris]